MNSKTWEMLEKQHEVILNALGVYEALELVGGDKMLPGYNRCLDLLKSTIIEYKEFRKGEEICLTL